jgi:hypothetical protein
MAEADAPLCSACGQPIEEDQQAIKLSIGVGHPTGFSHLLMREDAYLHAGRPNHGPWGDEPSNEKWCATPEGFDRALWTLHIHGVTGGSGTYSGE